MTWMRSASVKNRLSVYCQQSRVESCFCDCWNALWRSLWRHEHGLECLRSAPAFSTLPRHEADAWHDNETFASRSTPFHAGKGANQKHIPHLGFVWSSTLMKTSRHSGFHVFHILHCPHSAPAGNFHLPAFTYDSSPMYELQERHIWFRKQWIS